MSYPTIPRKAEEQLYLIRDIDHSMPMSAVRRKALRLGYLELVMWIDDDPPPECLG